MLPPIRNYGTLRYVMVVNEGLNLTPIEPLFFGKANLCDRGAENRERNVFYWLLKISPVAGKPLSSMTQKLSKIDSSISQ